MAECKTKGSGVKRITLKEWEEEGTRLFGPDKLKWKFVCPSCGNIQTAEDFRKYKDQGAQPDSATHKCIGRYSGAGDVVMCSGKSPCNYTGYGLFNICPVLVTDEKGNELRCFGFAPRSTTKALSVKQPWAELIASGRKTVETRTWCTKYRGPLLICASKTIDNRACSHLGFVPNRMEAGLAVAIVDLVDCRPMVEADCSRAMCGLNKYAWVLENARRIEQFPVKGQLGVFEVDYKER